MKCFVVLNGMTEPAAFPVESAGVEGDKLVREIRTTRSLGASHVDDVRAWWRDLEIKAKWGPPADG